MEIFASRLRDLRMENKITQAEMAKILNIKQQSYARYENNTSEPGYEMLVRISKIFSVSCDYLLGNEDY